jgi:hypothetical protein
MTKLHTLACLIAGLALGWSGQTLADDLAKASQNPVGGGIGKLMRFGEQQVNLTLKAYKNVVHPDAGPEWSIVAGVSLLFPKPDVKTAEDMLGSAIYLRPSTSFDEHLSALNTKRAAEGRQRFKDVADLLKTYAGQYDFDWLMLAAQGYQESQLDRSKRSHVGAIGVMQVMPATAKDPNVEIAMAQAVSRELVVYVRNIYKYYVAYKLLTEGKATAEAGDA